MYLKMGGGNNGGYCLKEVLTLNEFLDGTGSGTVNIGESKDIVTVDFKVDKPSLIWFGNAMASNIDKILACRIRGIGSTSTYTRWNFRIKPTIYIDDTILPTFDSTDYSIDNGYYLYQLTAFRGITQQQPYSSSYSVTVMQAQEGLFTNYGEYVQIPIKKSLKLIMNVNLTSVTYQISGDYYLDIGVSNLYTTTDVKCIYIFEQIE